MKASDLLVKSLENEGVQFIFGLPGEENLDLIESLRASNIKFIVTRHEQAAGFMAATIGRLTGKTGVCLSTLGPGATNLVTAAAFANLGAMPMLMITGQKPIKKSKQGQFQIVDAVEMMRPLTKFTKQIIHGNTIPALVRACFRYSEEERPGTTHLELPEDIAKEDCDMLRRTAGDEKAIDHAVAMIEDSKHPLILIGAGSNRKIVYKALRQFIDKTGIYFFNTQMGKGVIDERHPLFLGTAALSDNDYVHCAINKADLIINVGHDIVEKPPFFMRMDNGAQVIHINFVTARIDDIYFPQLEVIGDIGNCLWQIMEKVTVKKSWDFEYFKKIKAEIDAHIQEKTSDSSFPLKPQRIVSDTRSIIPADGILALDNGMYKIWFARNYQAYEGNTLLLDNALASMGGGLPSAIAAKVLFPEKIVVAMVGDGGFMMNSQELETARRLKLNLVIIILKDNGYGMIKWKQKEMGLSDFGLDFGNPDFVKYAQSYGVKGYHIESAAQFKKILEECLPKEGIHLIETPIDYSENQKVFSEELKQKVCVSI